MNLIPEFTKHVKACIAKAEGIYGPLGDIAIRFDLKGLTAGMAGYTSSGGQRKYYLRFNFAAIRDHWEEMSTNTIFHEVAHLVAFAHPISEQKIITDSGRLLMLLLVVMAVVVTK